jgi:hypothetical protein
MLCIHFHLDTSISGYFTSKISMGINALIFRHDFRFRLTRDCGVSGVCPQSCHPQRS